jgi:hypothetical protein
MPQTIRKFWPDPFPFGRRASLNFNWDAIDSDSVVLITAAGYVPQPNPPPDANLQRVLSILGPSIAVRVDNISPHGPPFDANHGVTFSITVDVADGVDTDNSLFVATDITVFDDKPIETQV